jgi:hypothetical protein
VGDGPGLYPEGDFHHDLGLSTDAFVASSSLGSDHLRNRRLTQMAVYMVERDLPGITLEQLGSAQKAAIDTSKRLTEDGRPVRYIRSTYVPGEARCMCLFEAPNAQRVREVNEEAQIPFTRIVEALDLTPKER